MCEGSSQENGKSTPSKSFAGSGGSQNAHPFGAQRRHWRDPLSREPGLEHARPGSPSVAVGGQGVAASKCRQTDMYSFEVKGDKIPSSEDLVSCLTDWEKMMRTNSDEAVSVIKQRWAILRDQLQGGQDLALRLHPEGQFRARRPARAPEPSRPARGHSQEVRPAANKFGIASCNANSWKTAKQLLAHLSTLGDIVCIQEH
eukprot:7061616-Pyramimonas_sp.AAC.1